MELAWLACYGQGFVTSILVIKTSHFPASLVCPLKDAWLPPGKSCFPVWMLNQIIPQPFTENRYTT